MNAFSRSIVIGTACVLLWACQSSSSDWATDEAALKRLLQDAADAFNRGDLPGHLESYDDNVTFMTKNGQRPGVAPIEKAFREAYFKDGKPKQMLRFEQMGARRLSPDVALVTGRYILSGGADPDQTGWFTTVWTRTARGWKVVHDHSS
jgi:uncharacterized protein (TIGR02246 family)